MHETKKNYYILLITAIAAIGGLLFGFDTGVISGALQLINQRFHPSVWQQELIVSTTVLGAFIGALCSGKVTDEIGRRYTLILAAVIFLIGTTIAFSAMSIDSLIAGRFVLGLGIGIASYSAPLFISELAPANQRGKLVLINGFALTGGQVIAFLTDYYFNQSHNWRAMIGLGIIPALLLLIGMLISPASPRWLISRGKVKRAVKILQKIRRKHDVSHEINDIQTLVNHANPKAAKLFSKALRPMLMVGIGLGVLQQFMGINTIMYYGPTVFQQIGFSSSKAQMLATLGLGIVNFIATIITLLMVDRIGRRRLLIIGTILAATSLLTVTFLCQPALALHHSTKYFDVACLVLYIAGYSMSIGSLFWLVITEIFPLHIRGTAISFVASIQWGANFLVSQTYLTMLSHLGRTHSFLIYALMCCLACWFVIKKVPETKGQSLESLSYTLSHLH